MVKKSAANAGDTGLIPVLGRSHGGGNGNPLQYSCLENSLDRGAWWATAYGAAKSWTRHTQTHTHTQTEALTHTHTHIHFQLSFTYITSPENYLLCFYASWAHCLSFLIHWNVFHESCPAHQPHHHRSLMKQVMGKHSAEFKSRWRDFLVEKEHWSRSEQTWVRTQVLTISSFVTLGKSRPHSGLWLTYLSMSRAEPGGRVSLAWRIYDPLRVRIPWKWCIQGTTFLPDLRSISGCCWPFVFNLPSHSKTTDM